MVLIFFARLVDESFVAFGMALTNRFRAWIDRNVASVGARSALDVCDRFARSRRRRSLASYPTRVLALRQATCTVPAQG